LSANRKIWPLFDTAGYTRAIESAFSAAWKRRLLGDEPADIAL
jgi:hypothetical protein